MMVDPAGICDKSNLIRDLLKAPVALFNSPTGKLSDEA